MCFSRGLIANWQQGADTYLVGFLGIEIVLRRVIREGIAKETKDARKILKDKQDDAIMLANELRTKVSVALN